MKSQTITLGGERAQVVLHAIQGEANSQAFRFRIVSRDGTPLTFPEGAAAAFYVNNGDTPVQLACTVYQASSEIGVTLSLAACAKPGWHKCFLQVYKGDQDLWQGSITLAVEPNPAVNIPDRPEIQILTEIMESGWSMVAETNQATSVLRALEDSLITGLKLEHTYSYKSGEGVGTPIAAATDLTGRWFVAGTDSLSWTDDGEIFITRGLPDTGTPTEQITGIGVNGSTVYVIAKDGMFISDTSGETFPSRSILNSALSEADRVKLRPYKEGVMAVPEGGKYAVYIDRSSTKAFTINRGTLIDVIPCGAKLVRVAVTGSGAALASRIEAYDSLADLEADESSGSASIAGKSVERTGWEGQYLYLFCADRSVYRVAIGDIGAGTELIGNLPEGVTLCGDPVAIGSIVVCPAGESGFVTARGKELKVISTGSAYLVAAASAGKLMLANAAGVAFFGFAVDTSWIEAAIQEIENRAGTSIESCDEAAEALEDAKTAFGTWETQTKSAYATWLNGIKADLQTQIGLSIKLTTEDIKDGQSVSYADGTLLLVYKDALSAMSNGGASK